MKTIRPRDLYDLLRSGQPGDILDIRPTTNFQEGHINGAQSLPSAELSPQTVLLARQLPVTEPLYLVSQSGALAQLTACELERQGLENVIIVAGGMCGWLRDSLPTVKNDTAALVNVSN